MNERVSAHPGVSEDMLIGKRPFQEVEILTKNCPFRRTLPTSSEDPLFVDSVVEWLKRRARDQFGLSSKPTCAVLLCPWERHFTTYSPAWWSWQAVLNLNHVSIKL